MGFSKRREREYSTVRGRENICHDELFTFFFFFALPMNIKYHVDKLVSKLQQKIGFLCRNRTSFPLISRRRVIETVFLSVLDYGNVICRHLSAVIVTAPTAVSFA